MRIGIDYGSKLAGTTVIAYQKNGSIHLVKSVKNKDADLMILEFVKENNVSVVGIDAPLSLPGVYSKLTGYDDYHYRVCDKALKAMSPMFLGGLTARAMKLKAALTEKGIQVLETYPVKTGQSLFSLEMGFRSKHPDYASMIKVLGENGMVLSEATQVKSSHDLDAILALMVVINVELGNHCQSGDEEEGIIHF